MWIKKSLVWILFTLASIDSQCLPYTGFLIPVYWLFLVMHLSRQDLFLQDLRSPQCGAQCAVRCSAVQCSAAQCGDAQCGAAQCSAAQCSAVQCSAVRSAVQRSAVQRSAVRSAQCGVASSCRISSTSAFRVFMAACRPAAYALPCAFLTSGVQYLPEK